MEKLIVEKLQMFFHQRNAFLALFTTAYHLINYKIAIKAEKTPAGQHVKRLNAPTINNVSIVFVDENLENRSIVLYRRNDKLQCVFETCRL